MSVIRDQPSFGMNELASRLNVCQPTASNLVKSLARRAMVQVCRGSGDKRNAEISITETGLLAVNRAPGPINGVLPHALADLSPEVLMQLEQNVSLLVAKLRTDEQAARIPLRVNLWAVVRTCEVVRVASVLLRCLRQGVGLPVSRPSRVRPWPRESG